MTVSYYTNKREEMIKFIPTTCTKILEVGCGEGVFASVLKNKLNIEIWGVELSGESANKAKTILDKVIIADFTMIINTLPKKYFDCLVFNDVLEHIADPFSLLERIKILLKDGGYIVSSIPNVRYIGNLVELLFHKDWRYKDGGILDITHFRFFTQKSIIRMFHNAGYEIIRNEGINPTKSIKVKLLGLLSLGLFADTKYMQFATVARIINK
jgi:2-polyprenyl-3-methyl-5-hydroxy-6-metoxy-1,4-benzoquinol methylase